MSKFHVYHQHDSMQCGIACLQMICKYHGKEYSQDTLSRYCFATNEGVSLLGISEAATRLGLHTTCGRVTTEQLHKAPLPCILHWNQNHFVVLYRIKKGKICYIADPGKGLVTYDDREFKEHWLSTRSNGEEKGIAMFLQPTPAFYKQQEETTKDKRSFRFLLGYLRQYRRYFGQIILGALVGCLLQLIFPFLTQAIVDVGIVHQNLNFIYLILLGQLVLTISRASVDFIRRWILLHISMRINISLVSDFFIKLLKLPMSFFDTKLMGDLMQRMNDHNRIEKFLTTQMLNVTFSLLSFVVFGCVLFSYNLTIFCIFLLASILYALWIALFLGKRKILDYELFEKQAENSNKTYQFITAMQEIKLQDCEQRRRWEWEDVQADLFGVQMKSLKLQQTQEAGSIFINEVKNIVITVVAATAVIHGQMTLGMMLSVQYIIGQLNSPVNELIAFARDMQDARLSMDRLSEVRDKPDEEDPTRELLREIPEGKEIRLQNLNFKYDPLSEYPTLDDINLVIPPGMQTAIVGMSGSGKTTLVKLLLGFYPPASGDIFIGDTPLGSYSIREWRKRCGVVMQDGFIFSDSIAGNIAPGVEQIDKKRLRHAAEVANIHDFIEELPLAYNTKIGQEGHGLRRGQKQRILIARAVYKDPEFIFFDEATNALDANNERTIMNNLQTFFKGRTSVVVAHRLSTVRNAEQIIVIEQGRIAETGTHEALIALEGRYYKLVKNQLEL